MLKDLVSPESASTENTCAGCGASIKDRYYLLAADRAWHGQCLRCCRCSQPLDTELSCFCRGGNIYCKEDYCRIFSTRRCAKCGDGLSTTELVMRARDLIFHINCFTCTLCKIPLNAGDTAAIHSGQLFCGDHLEPDLISIDNDLQSHEFYCGSPQKGRPRKRKQIPPASVHQHHHQITSSTGGGGGSLSDSETSANLDGSETPLRLDILSSDMQSSSLDLSYDGSSHSPNSSGCVTPQTRTKRMRTSFKHHQLRTMKSYFAINQNPDAKDLKQLAQKTGLSKRVLQVWFQNARAKWRRNMMRQEQQANGTLGKGIMGPGGILPNIASLTSSMINESCQHLQTESVLENINRDSPSQASSLDDIHQMTFAELY